MDTLTIADVTESLGPRQPLHTLDGEMTIGAALDSLDKQKLIVAPVNVGGKLSALVSVFDLVNYAVLQSLPEGNEGSLEPEAIPALQHKVQNALTEPVGRFDLPEVKLGDNILQAMNAFSEGKHKVLVLDNVGEPHFMFSQHDLIKFMNDNPSSVPENISGMNAIDLGFTPRKDLVTSSPHAPVIEVLRLLAKHDVTAVPLLDSKGHVVGTFSQSDLKGMATVMLVDLFLEAMKFLEDEEARGAGRPITVLSDAKFGEVIIPLACSGAHRVWVVDEENHVTGVASMTGVISSVTTSLWK